MIIFSEHAKLRMHKREVSKEEVESVLESPDIQYPSFLGRKIARKTIGGREITVVYVEEERDNVIVTVYAEGEKT